MRIGCQIGIWRGALDLSGAIAATSALGCRGLEVFDTDIVQHYGNEGPLREELQRAGIVLAGASFTSEDFANAAAGRALLNRARRACDFLQAVGAEFLVLDGGGRREPGRQFTEAELAQCAAAMNRIGREAQGRGLQAVVRPRRHCLVETAADVQRLLAAGLNAEVVGLCADAGHEQHAGADPYAVYEQHASRVRYLHISDSGPDHRGALVGRGVLDQRRLMRPLLAAGYDGWVIIDGSHDEVSGDDYVRHAQRYLSTQWPEVAWDGAGPGIESRESGNGGSGHQGGQRLPAWVLRGEDEESTVRERAEEGPVQQIELSEVDRAVGPVALGTIAFSQARRDMAWEVLDAFLAAGGGLVDTAASYQEGEAERVIGEWWAVRGRPTEIVLMDKGNEAEGTLTPEGIREALEVSLRRLGMDYIDLWVIHRDHPEVPVGPVVETLHAEVIRGRVRGYGFSNWSTSRLAEALEHADRYGLRRPSISSLHVSLARPLETVWGHQHAALSDLAWHAEVGLPIAAWAPLGHGFLSDNPMPFPESRDWVMGWYHYKANFARLARARELAEAKGVTVAQVALAYVLHLPPPVVAIAGALTREEVASALAAADLVLQDSEVKWLNLEMAKLPAVA
jgi:aryl-alcohol dehydrogenase-like predicted oxidoreductase/sugar phosphate isomerase/epimerase